VLSRILNTQPRLVGLNFNPHTHDSSLILGVTELLTEGEAFKTKIEIVPTLFAIIGVIGVFLISYGFYLRGIEIAIMKGEIIPFKVDPNENIEVQIGGIHVITTIDKLSEGFNLTRYVNLGFDYPFQIKLQNGKFLISTVVRNEEGEIIAKIVDNNWVVNENRIIARDRNYNSYAFEVINSDLIPVIQIVFYPQNKMYLGGLFYVPSGRMLLTPETTIFNPSSSDVAEENQKIFVYPSEQNLGLMVNESLQITNSIWLIIVGFILSILGAIVFSNTIIQKKRKRTKIKNLRKRRIPRARKNEKDRASTHKKKKKG